MKVLTIITVAASVTMKALFVSYFEAKISLFPTLNCAKNRLEISWVKVFKRLGQRWIQNQQT